VSNGGEYSPRSLPVYGSEFMWWSRGSTMGIHTQNIDPYFLHVFLLQNVRNGGE